MKKLVSTCLLLVLVATVHTPVPVSAATTLSAAERSGLQRMREEEKLAHDVYARFAAKWDIGPFSNISQAEERHMSAVAGLLEQHGIDDPTRDKAPGEFSDAELARLYGELVARGESSAEAAVAVGLDIEELDIHDLERLRAQTTDAQIDRVYDNLLHASENHFRAFHRWLSRRDAQWQPKHLSAERVAAILAEPQQPGGCHHGAAADQANGAQAGSAGAAAGACGHDAHCGAMKGCAGCCGKEGCAHCPHCADAKGCAECCSGKEGADCPHCAAAKGCMGESE